MGRGIEGGHHVRRHAVGPSPADDQRPTVGQVNGRAVAEWIVGSSDSNPCIHRLGRLREQQSGACYGKDHKHTKGKGAEASREHYGCLSGLRLNARGSTLEARSTERAGKLDAAAQPWLGYPNLGRLTCKDRENL